MQKQIDAAETQAEPSTCTLIKNLMMMMSGSRGPCYNKVEVYCELVLEVRQGAMINLFPLHMYRAVRLPTSARQTREKALTSGFSSLSLLPCF